MFNLLMALLPCLIIGFVVIALSAVGLSIYGLHRKSTVLTIAGASTFLLFSTCALVAIIIYFRMPENAFKDIFGLEPTTDIKDIRTEIATDPGYSHTFMKFQASPATVERMVAQRGLEQVPDSFTPYSSSPDWWQPPSNGNVVKYGGEFSNRLFRSETEVLIYDRASRTVYYFFIGMD